jgi:hypothetical protein
VSGALRSILGNAVGREPMTDAELKSMAAAVFHQTGFICLKADWVNSPVDREYVAQVATKVHGRRRVGGK